MSDAEQLKQIKSALLITGNHFDVALNMYLQDIKQYMLSAGVNSDTLKSETSLGTIARGVSDLWNFGNGNGKLSPYFYERVIQLYGGHSDTSDGNYDDSTIDDIILRLTEIERSSPVTKEEVDSTFGNNEKKRGTLWHLNM